MTINAHSDPKIQTGSGRRTMSLRTRLLVLFILLASLPALLTGIVAGFINAQGLSATATEQLDSVVVLKSNEIKDWLATLQTHLGMIMKDTASLDRAEMILEGSANTRTIRGILRNKFNDINRESGYFEELFLLDVDGKIIVSTNESQEGKIAANQGYFNEGLKGAYVVPPAYDVALSRYSIIFSRPVTTKQGRLIGVIAGRANLNTLQKIMSERAGLGITGETYLVGRNYVLLSQLQFSDSKIGESYIRSTGTNNAIRSKTQGHAAYKDYRGVSVLGSYSWIPELQAALIAEHDESEALRSANQAFATTIGLMALSIFVAAGAAILAARSIVTPIANLVSVSQAVTAGDLSAAAKEDRADEIGALASAFNAMTGRLRELIGSLEQRVAERTAKMERRNLDLALAAEVGQTVSQVRDINSMLSDAAEIIRAFFGLYYVQIYLVNPEETELILQFGTGKVGEQLMAQKHRLPLNENSINGRAAISKRSVVISDTAQSSFFRPNPLLPNTRSEIAVPLLIGNKLIGVMDVQSETPNHLNEEALLAFEPMSGQMAVAIQNARLIAETQQARHEVEALARRLTREGWTEYLDAIHKPEELGFAFDGADVVPLEEADQKATGRIVSAPIAVAGETLGSLSMEIDENAPAARVEELLHSVSRQVAEHIENVRLLESAERYRLEAEQATRRAAREGWKELVGAKRGKMGFLYDLNEVKPLEGAPQQHEKTALTAPLKVRDANIGLLTALDVNADDSEAVELVNAVAERLAGHIENLRLSQQTFERAQREQILSQITRAVRGSTDPETILRAAVRELGSIFGAKTAIRVKTKNAEEKTAPQA